MSRPSITTERPVDVMDRVELRYCFLCDADGHHLSFEIEGVYVFQCTTCFASHTEPMPGSAAPAGRHRA